MRTTDINAVKDVALSFLYMDIEETEFSPMVIIHPIYESGIIYSPVSKKVVNLFENQDGLREIKCYLEKKILEAKDVTEVYSWIRKPFKLAFFKYINQYLSAKDYAYLLADSWTNSENPNQDINVSLKESIGYFEKANKKMLMCAEDYAVYINLPHTITIYRGVAYGRASKGLSWTQNIKTAKWFSERFNRGDKKGYVEVATISRENVLAYFNTRNEDELVVDIRQLQNISIME